MCAHFASGISPVTHPQACSRAPVRCTWLVCRHTGSHATIFHYAGISNMVLRCSNELLSKDLRGNVYIVTGATSGIGKATAKQLAKQGGTVVIGCRNLAAGHDVASELNLSIHGSVEAFQLDLSSLVSVRQFATDVSKRYSELKALINNAGVNFSKDPRQDPANDSEVIFHTNHVGPFFLTQLLLPLLKAGAPSRVINVSSGAHEGHLVPSVPHINFDDLEWRSRKYNSLVAYAESKLMSVLHAEEIARRHGSDNIIAASVQPGLILVGSRLTRDMLSPAMKAMMIPIGKCFLGAVSVEDGMQTTLHCTLAGNIQNGACTRPRHHPQTSSPHELTSPKVPDPEFQNLRPLHDVCSDYAQDGGGARGGWPRPSTNPDVGNPEIAKRLWEVTERIVNTQ